MIYNNTCKKCKKVFQSLSGNSKYCNECKNIRIICNCGCGNYLKEGSYIKGLLYLKGHARKNKVTSEEHKFKIGLSNKEKIMSKEAIDKIRISKIGKRHTQESKQKMSRIAKEKSFGKWMDKKWEDPNSIFNSIQYRQKLSNTKIGHKTSNITKTKISLKNSGEHNGFYGKKHTTESKEIISSSIKMMWKNQEIRDRILNNPNRIKNCRKGALAAYKKIKENGFCNTEPEIKMKNILNELNLEYIQSKEIIDIEHVYPADFYIEKYNLIIETDGVYWHNYPNGREIDRIRDKELINTGYKIIRFWEGMFNIDLVKKKIQNLILKERI